MAKIYRAIVEKIEPVGLRKCPYYHCLTTKVMTSFSQSLPRIMAETAGIDMVRRNYITVTLSIDLKHDNVTVSIHTVTVT